jgi:hypothetical protein
VNRASQAAAQGARNAAHGAAFLALTAMAVSAGGAPKVTAPPPPASSCPAGEHLAQNLIGLPECEGGQS